MQISELIKRLEEIKNTSGDIQCTISIGDDNWETISGLVEDTFVFKESSGRPTFRTALKIW